MKTLKAVIFISLFLTGCKQQSSNLITPEQTSKSITNDSMVIIACNFQYNEFVTEFTFDVYIKRITSKPFTMGSSTFTLDISENVFDSAYIVYANPLYNQTYYYPMTATLYYNDNPQKVSLQLYYISGAGSGVPSVEFVKVATIGMLPDQNTDYVISWNTGLSFVQNPDYNTARANWLGSFDY